MIVDALVHPTELGLIHQIVATPYRVKTSSSVITIRAFSSADVIKILSIGSLWCIGKALARSQASQVIGNTRYPACRSHSERLPLKPGGAGRSSLPSAILREIPKP